jgi:arylsulfatase A-like enzyme
MPSRLIFFVFAVISSVLSAADKPNILWITSEDHGPEMGCYGDALARTPNVDALAAKGMLFKKAWSVAPVCAPARTGIITGIYPSSSGGIHMRSSVAMPAAAKMYPQFLQEAGYYCTNNSKTDYNLEEPKNLWNESSPKASWKSRAEGQPFFAVFNSTKSHESQIRNRPHKQITKPADVRVPAYHPDTPEVRQDWAQYYDRVTEADADAGSHLQEIAKAGLAEDTIVFYYADHGSGMPRSKRWPCNSGLHVPMVVYFPQKWQHLAPKEYSAGGKSDRLVCFIDLAPTLLSLIGIQPPEWMQGHAFAGPYQSEPQPFIFGQRGRMDERMDLVRSVTDGRYVYLRNFYPHVSQAQRVAFQFSTPTTRVWYDLFTQNKTTPAQSLFWQVPKAPEELYDLQTDRDEVQNLAQSAEHQTILERMRAALKAHIMSVRDVGFLPELEMHKRAEKKSPYDMARDGAKYPLDHIYAAADLASGLDPAAVPTLVKLMADPDSAVRFWAALGLHMRGEAVVKANSSALKKALADESSDVRIVAAQALGTYGDSADLALALEALGKLATPADNGVLTAMAALPAIEALGPKAAPLHAAIATMKASGASPDPRFDSYVPRLIENLSGNSKPKAKKAQRAEMK